MDENCINGGKSLLVTCSDGGFELKNVVDDVAILHASGLKFADLDANDFSSVSSVISPSG